MNDIIIIGAGGHGVVVRGTLSYKYQFLGFLDDTIPKYTIPPEVIGTVSDATKYITSGTLVFVAIGDNTARRAIVEKLPHFKSIVIFNAKRCSIHTPFIEAGSFVADGGCVGNRSKVGKFSIINTNASLDHDSELGDFSHLAPGVVTGGRVKIGSGTLVGIGAMIRDGITIGNNVTIGMGSVVTNNIPDGVTALGNPCRVK